MKFLIQHNLINPKHLLDIKDAIKNYPHEFVGLIPFSHEVTSEEPLDGIDYIPYGSTSFIETALDLGWKGLSFDLSTANYEAFMANRNDMLNDCIWKLEDCITYLKHSSYPLDSLWFIRPSKDLKEFTGEVATAKEWIDILTDRMQCASSGSYKLEPDTMVVLSRPKEILAEYRWFIVDGKVITGSQYRNKGQLSSRRIEDPDMIAEAQRFADGWLPNKNVVMDLALLESGEVKVVEFNCINSSGVYDCDIKKIFDALWSYYE